MAKKEKYYESHDVHLRFSRTWWRKFDRWWQERGCTTRAGGVRHAIMQAMKHRRVKM